MHPADRIVAYEGHAPFSLTPSQIEAFFEEGFLIIEAVFRAEEIEAMRQAFDRLYAVAQTLAETTYVRGSQFVVERQRPDHPAGPVKIHRICWCGAAEPLLLDVGADPRLLVPASQLLGSPTMEHLINQAHFKLPEDGVSFPWHQDSVHRRYGTELWNDRNGRGSYVQTAIALDAVTQDNGPLLFLPGSGKLGHLDSLAKGEGPLPFDPSKAVPACASPGGVLFFGPYTIHGSAPNRSAFSRRIFLNGYAYPGANKRVYPGEGAGRTLSIKRM